MDFMACKIAFGAQENETWLRRYYVTKTPTRIFNGRFIKDEQVKLHYDSELSFETCGRKLLFFFHRREQNFLIINNFNFQIFSLCHKISKVQSLHENLIQKVYKGYSLVSAYQRNYKI